MLGVSILNWNQASDTVDCVYQVLSWPVPDKRIWVVDNGSRTDDANQLIRSVRGAEIIRSPINLGFAGGNNLAIKRALEAGCSAILLLNNDARMNGDAITCLLDTLIQHPRIGIVGPIVVAANDPNRLLAAGGRDIAQRINSHVLDPLPPGELRRVDYVPGTCALIRSEVLRQIGLLDEAYFFGGEMADLCARAHAAGWASVVNGSAIVQHDVTRSAQIRRQLHAYYIIRNRFRFARKFHHRSRLFLYALWTCYGICASLSAAIEGDPARARAVLLGCLDGWLGRFGGQNRRVTRGQLD